MSPLSARAAYWRFLALTALRWVPVGLLIPGMVLLPLQRGLTLSQLGLVAAAQGLVVLALELPTGGLADAVGRRAVLATAAVVGLVATGLYLAADSMALFAVAFALQGVYRALDSGPLEAWYVDAALAAALAADRDADITRGLSGHGVVLGVAVAGGASLSGGLIALDPLPFLDALAVPVAAALALQVVGLAGIVTLMAETRPGSGLRAATRAVTDTPRTIAAGVRLLRLSPVLLAIVAVELFWGFGMITFEGLFPVRLAELVDSAAAAAAITGPASSAGWLVSAAGAACVPWLGRRLGTAPTAALLRILQGVAVVGMGAFGGVVGVVTAYLACYAVHGAANPAHMTLLHRQVDGPLRATILSLNSMVSMPAGALGGIVLTALADGMSVSVAMYAGAAVLAVAAPLYLPAWRQSRQRRRAAAVDPATA